MRTRIVALMFLFSVMSYFDRTILSIAAPGIMKEFSISETQMGVVFSSFLLSYTLLMIPCGRLADRFGPRSVLTVSAMGSGVATALFSVSATIPIFAALRLLLGAFTAPLYPATGKMNANWISPHLRARVQGIVNCGAGLGGAVSPLLFPALIATYGWRQSFIIAGMVTFAIGLIWRCCVADRPKPEETPPRKPAWGRLFRNRRLMILTAGMFALAYFEYIFFFWIYYYLVEIRKMGLRESALGTTALFVAWVILMPLGGWVADRLNSRLGKPAGFRAVGTGGVVLSSLCLFAGAWVENVTLAVGLMSLSLGFCAAADIVYWAAAIDASGEDAGAGCGIMNAGGNLGGFFAPIVTPWLAQMFGWTTGLYFGGLLALATVLVWRKRTSVEVR